MLAPLSSFAKRVVNRFNTAQSRVFLPHRPTPTPTGYLAAAAIFKNEALHIAEWVEFHRLVGVEHIYLYDNASTDGSADVLAPFIREGFVTLTPWPLPWFSGSVDAQVLAYAHALMAQRLDWRWIAFIDLDEFLFPADGSDLPDVLRDYEDLPALGVFWTMFGFSGNDAPPVGLTIENYRFRAPFPTHAKIKSIVNPAEVVAVSNPHLFDLRAGPRRAYTEARGLYEKQEGFRERKEVGEPFDGRLRLNHYYTRSRAEFEAKVGMRNAAGRKDANKLRKIAAELDREPRLDEAILRFAPELKRRMRRSGGTG